MEDLQRPCPVSALASPLRHPRSRRPTQSTCVEQSIDVSSKPHRVSEGQRAALTMPRRQTPLLTRRHPTSAPPSRDCSWCAQCSGRFGILNVPRFSKAPPSRTTRAMDELSAERQEHVHELEWKLHEATEGTRSELARLRSELVRTRRQLELSEMDRNQIAADLDLLAQGMTSLCERCVLRCMRRAPSE